MPNIQLHLAPHLDEFNPEIGYTMKVLEHWLGLKFGFSNLNSPSNLAIYYGKDLPFQRNAIVVHEEFFSKYLQKTPDGLRVSRKSLNEIPKNAKNASYEQEVVKVIFSNDSKEIVEYVSSINGYRINFDLFGIIFFHLTRIEELCYKSVDHIHRFPLSESIIKTLKTEKRATVDEAVEVFRGIVRNYIELAPLQKMKVHLTHDVDRLRSYHGYYSLFREKLGQTLKGKQSLISYWQDIYFKLFSNEPKRSFPFLMDYSEKYNVKSTFLFLAHSNHPNDATYTVRFKKDFLRTVSEIKARGHDIGFHPGWETYNNYEIFLEQKNFLENLIEQKVTVCRQHILRWQPPTWRIQADCGITTDYTLAYLEGTSFRSQTTRSYPVYDLRDREILPLNSVPTSIMDFTLFMDKYLDISRDAAYEEIHNCVETHRKFGGDLTVLFHTITVMDYLEEYNKTLEIIFS